MLVVDDHTLFRRGLIALLAGDARFAVVAEAGDAGEAQRRAAETQPDVILLDNHLPGVQRRATRWPGCARWRRRRGC